MIQDRFGESALYDTDDGGASVSGGSGYLSFGRDALYDEASVTFGSGSTEESVGVDPTDPETDVTDSVELSDTAEDLSGALSFGRDALQGDGSVTFGSGSTQESVGVDPTDPETDVTDSIPASDSILSSPLLIGAVVVSVVVSVVGAIAGTTGEDDER